MYFPRYSILCISCALTHSLVLWSTVFGFCQGNVSVTLSRRARYWYTVYNGCFLWAFILCFFGGGRVPGALPVPGLVLHYPDLAGYFFKMWLGTDNSFIRFALLLNMYLNYIKHWKSHSETLTISWPSLMHGTGSGGDKCPTIRHDQWLPIIAAFGRGELGVYSRTVCLLVWHIAAKDGLIKWSCNMAGCFSHFISCPTSAYVYISFPKYFLVVVFSC